MRLLLCGHGIGERSHGGYFTDYLQRDALKQIALATSVGQQTYLGTAQHIDKAGRDGLAVRIDHAFGSHRFWGSDIRNLIAVDDDVSDIRLAARAVVDGSALDQDVMSLRRSWLRLRDCACEERCHDRTNEIGIHAITSRAERSPPISRSRKTGTCHK